MSILFLQMYIMFLYQFHPWKKIIHTPEMKSNTNEDERSEVIPDVISQSADNLEMKVIDETQTSRNVVHVMKEGFNDDQTHENEELKINYENDGQELEPDSPVSNKAVLVNEEWKQNRQQSTNQ